ncbi:MAG: aspartate--tRNA(Asn) ligase [Candidatus Woesearchaeota archaeon]
MQRTKISDLKNQVGKLVNIKGFVHEIRIQSKIHFLIIRDISGLVQCISLKSNDDVFSTTKDLQKESVISLIGLVKEESQAPGGFEIEIKEIDVLSKVLEELPIQVNDKGVESSLSVRLDNRWIDLRKPKNALIFKIWTAMEEAMREWWSKEGFIQVYSPKFMGSPSESGAELFSVDYFGKKAFLAQSPQFFKQMAMSSGFEKIFEIGPVFRANPSHTSRHDTEFTMIDMELSFIESHEDVMKVEESWLRHVLLRLKERFGSEIKEVFGVDVTVPSLPFPRITLDEALKILKSKGHVLEDDLDPQGERMLYEYIKEKHGHDFVFVTEYPYSIRPFYHMKKEGGLTKSYDLLWRGLEITTGAQREHRYDVLKEQAIEKGLDLNLIDDYLKFFKYGCPPHGGFGLSPSRMVMILLGIKNVRDVTYLPRDTSRLNP